MWFCSLFLFWIYSYWKVISLCLMIVAIIKITLNAWPATDMIYHIIQIIPRCYCLLLFVLELLVVFELFVYELIFQFFSICCIISRIMRQKIKDIFSHIVKNRIIFYFTVLYVWFLGSYSYFTHFWFRIHFFWEDDPLHFILSLRFFASINSLKFLSTVGPL